MEKVIKVISSLLYIGYIPIAPGSFGSLGGVAVWYLTRGNFRFYVVLTLLLIGIGFLVSGKAEKIFGHCDSKRIVIDEASGAAISFFLIPTQMIYLMVGFLIFRLFDILKPYPIGKLQSLPGGFGIMADDLMAGVYTNLSLQILSKII